MNIIFDKIVRHIYKNYPEMYLSVGREERIPALFMDREWLIRILLILPALYPLSSVIWSLPSKTRNLHTQFKIQNSELSPTISAFNILCPPSSVLCPLSSDF